MEIAWRIFPSLQSSSGFRQTRLPCSSCWEHESPRVPYGYVSVLAGQLKGLRTDAPSGANQRRSHQLPRGPGLVSIWSLVLIRARNHQTRHCVLDRPTNTQIDGLASRRCCKCRYRVWSPARLLQLQHDGDHGLLCCAVLCALLQSGDQGA